MATRLLLPSLPSLLCCALGVGAWAAEDSPPADQPPDSGTEQIDPVASPPIEAAEDAQTEDAEPPDAESPDIFIPSEDISENIAVKFPVDI